jgi:hypothetical protein
MRFLRRRVRRLERREGIKTKRRQARPKGIQGPGGRPIAKGRGGRKAKPYQRAAAGPVKMGNPASVAGKAVR